MSRYKELKEHVGHMVEVTSEGDTIKLICAGCGSTLEVADRPKPKLKIVRDQDPQDPRTFDNISIMACWHRRYTLGDVQPSVSPGEWLATLPKGSEVLPVHMIDHSGIALSVTPFNDPWDSGRLGYIAMTPEQILENFGKKGAKRVSRQMREKARECMKVEVETYNCYVQGDVWGFEYEDEDTEDSCWGFIGSDDAAREHLKESIPEAGRALFEEAWNNRK